MCSGSKRKPSLTGFVIMEGLHYNKTCVLLEFSASDDLSRLKDAVEQEGLDVDEVGLWYGRRIGSNKLSFEERTPLMIASMFGSKTVVSYILGTGRVDVNRACGSDGATALHCAVSGGSALSPEVVKLLIDAGADVTAVDANGNRPCDLIVYGGGNFAFDSKKKKKIVEALLKGTELIDEVCVSFEEKEDQQQQDMMMMMAMPRAVSKDGTEKKDYPFDLSLPDIKSGIYGTDDFRMYAFKVKPCSRAYSHDWTECPFVHPGENARRRDPRKYHYSCVPCPEFRKGSCSKGDSCEYAHGIFECWLHPAQYRTRLCKDESGCSRRVCFFAHKPEELRPLYASTGSAIPSPRSFLTSSPGSLDIGPLSPLSLSSQSVMLPPTSTPPLTPSGASSPLGGSMWQTPYNGVVVPTLQLPRSRLKAASNARDIDFDVDFLGLENHRLRQQLMVDEMCGLSSPSGWKNPIPNHPFSLGDQAGELNRLEDIFGSVDPSILPKLQGISLDTLGLQSPTGIQAMRNYSSSPTNSNMMGSPPSGNDRSGAAAAAATMVMNPRLAAFSKRSQSFIERSSVVNHPPELTSPISAAKKPSVFPDWGSPNGKLDWTIHGEELNKLRKSASFGFRSNSNTNARMPEHADEPDVSWVHSLVKDAPPADSGQFRVEAQQQQQQQQQQQMQCHRDNGADVIPAWLEQFNVEQEQIVA